MYVLDRRDKVKHLNSGLSGTRGFEKLFNQMRILEQLPSIMLWEYISAYLYETNRGEKKGELESHSILCLQKFPFIG